MAKISCDAITPSSVWIRVLELDGNYAYGRKFTWSIYKAGSSPVTAETYTETCNPK
jgi:hypothetical protein